MRKWSIQTRERQLKCRRKSHRSERNLLHEHAVNSKNLASQTKTYTGKATKRASESKMCEKTSCVVM